MRQDLDMGPKSSFSNSQPIPPADRFQISEYSNMYAKSRHMVPLSGNGFRMNFHVLGLYHFKDCQKWPVLPSWVLISIYVNKKDMLFLRKTTFSFWFTMQVEFTFQF